MTYRAPHIPKDRPDSAIFRWVNDFLTYTAALWTITTTEAGAGAATEALATAEVGGVLVVTNDDADNDADFFQLLPAAGHFTFVSGKKMGWRARVKLSDASECDFIIGLYPTDTSPLDVDDGIYMRKDDGAATIDAFVSKNGTDSTQAAIATLVDDTYVWLEGYYNGDDKVLFSVDDVIVAGLAITNAPDDTQMRPSFGIQNGAAAAKILSVDYFEAWQER